MSTKGNASNVKRSRSSPSERITEAARKLFLSSGYDGVSIDQIARKARVSKPTIYSHFEGKEALFLSIMNEATSKIVSPLYGADTSGEDIESFLNAHARIYTRALLSPDSLAMNRLFIAEAARIPEVSRRYYELGPATAHASIAEFLRRRVQTGEIDCSDCLRAARIYASMIISPSRLRMQLIPSQPVNWDEIDELCGIAIKIFLNGLKRR